MTTPYPDTNQKRGQFHVKIGAKLDTNPLDTPTATASPNMPNALAATTATVTCLSTPTARQQHRSNIAKALEESGFLGDLMLTLAAPLGVAGCDENWFKKAVGKMMQASFKKYGISVQFQMVINRGVAGTGARSAHLIWKNELPKKVKFLESWWNRRFGCDRAHVSYHDRGIQYFVKNMGEPGALTHDGPHNKTVRPTKNRWRHYGR
jgi:hypothetical protein